MVSHPSKFEIDKLCEKIRNVDLNDLKTLDFNKLSREEKNKVEESVYAMMVEFKNTPLELDNTIPKELYEIVENKWHYCLKMEKEIREFTLAQVMPNLARGKITKANRKHGGKFAPKYRAFNILQNKIEDVVNKSTLLWRSIYKLIDDRDEDVNEAEASTKEKIEEKKQEGKQEKGEKETQKEEDMAIAEQQQ